MPALFRHWFDSLRPKSLAIARPEMLRATLGATLSVLIVSSLSLYLSDFAHTHHWLVASLAASALLIFLVPTSPLAQPWNVLLGNLVGALTGISCAILLPHPIAAITMAVCVAMPIMLALRCVHPPSVAMAVFPALNGIHNYDFALFPVLFDSCVLIFLGMLYNRLTGVTYPPIPKPTTRATSTLSRFTDQDYDAALSHYNQTLNISQDDLEKLVSYVHQSAFRRNLGTRRCATLMNDAPLSCQVSTPLQQAWDMMRERKIKALPVLDQDKHVIGILALSDFLQRAGLDQPDNLRQRLKRFLSPRQQSAPTVAEVMTSPAVTAHANWSVAELIPLFSQGRHRHMPVVNEHKELVGMITQSDLMLELFRILQPPRDQPD
ncbi:HPP family protein [Alcaligenes aquatilis]|uniref:HPP family protein n=1 Tax=Alcaligenes aquatilis TaxID=323284 RepID=A0A3G2HXE7_9BURK|nr:HPP family protein [Alcaligenes aquatilis]AYN21754.1 HPP family protein [Alcaligenes aquatilis]